MENIIQINIYYNENNFIYNNQIDSMFFENIILSLLNPFFEEENDVFDEYTNEKNQNIKLDLSNKILLENIKGESCTICISDFEKGEKITELECKHILHTECISEWVKYKSECPVCRSFVKTIKT